ncbi:MAG: hypothetical protein P8008_04185, partial [Gammaproteobacteria bacterium]
PILTRGMLAAVFVAALAVLLIALWPRGPGSDAPPAPEVGTLAVLPLANLTGDAGEDRFVEGLHDALITEISRNDDLRVTSRRSTLRYRDSDLPLAAIAEELGVGTLVEGSVMHADGRLRLNAQLVDGRSDTHLWAQNYEQNEQEVLGLVAQVAADIARELGAAPAARPAETPQFAPLDPAASHAYLEGLYYLNRFGAEDFRRAIGLFRETVTIEPGFAMGWGNLAAAQLMLAYYGGVPPGDGVERARDAALRALQIDDRFYVGHAAIGWVRLLTRDWSGAEEAFDEALRLNPSDPISLHGKADFLLFEGRMEESLALVRQGQRVDPFTFISNMPVAVHLFLMRRYDEAVDEMLALQERVAVFPAHWVMAFMYWQQGDQAAALEEDRKELEKYGDPALPEMLDGALAQAGPQAAVRAVAEALVQRSRTAYVDPFMIATVFARAGDREATLDWLERALDNGSLVMVYLPYWPQFDFVRDDPRYAALTRLAGPPG